MMVFSLSQQASWRMAQGRGTVYLARKAGLAQRPELTSLASLKLCACPPCLSLKWSWQIVSPRRETCVAVSSPNALQAQ